jgi:hypothetical protein
MTANLALQEEAPSTLDNCLVGTLDTWPLSDIVMWLHQSRRTAMLRVGAGLSAGVLFFKEGELFRCEWGPLGGEQALIALLGVRRASFSLIQREPPEARPNIHRHTPELLLQLAVAMDERHRGGQA